MSILGISLTDTTYKSKYGSLYLQEKNQISAVNSKSKSADICAVNKKMNKNKSVFTTLAIIAATAFVTYKGKNVIKGGFDKIKKATSNTAKKINFSGKFPNLTQAWKSLFEALKTPAKPFLWVGKTIGKLFKK